MRAEAASERARPHIDTLGAKRFFSQPELAEFTDLHWSLVYLVGRTCVAARGPRAATALMGYFPPAALTYAWAQASEAHGIDAFRDAYIAACDRIGERVFGELDDAEELADRLEMLVDETSFVGRPLAGAWADLPRPTTVGARIDRAVTVLREARGDDHLHVIAAHGLLGPEALLLKGLWDERDDPEATVRFFGWGDRADVDAAWARLEAAERVDADRRLTEQGRLERSAIEALTTAMSAQAWTEVAEDARERTVVLLERAAAAVQ